MALGTPHGSLDGFQLLEKRGRIKPSQNASGGVDEVRLRHRSEGTRAVETRGRYEPGLRQLLKTLESPEHLCTRILEVAANPDVGGLPGLHARRSGAGFRTCAAAPRTAAAARA